LEIIIVFAKGMIQFLIFLLSKLHTSSFTEFFSVRNPKPLSVLKKELYNDMNGLIGKDKQILKYVNLDG